MASCAEINWLSSFFTASAKRCQAGTPDARAGAGGHKSARCRARRLKSSVFAPTASAVAVFHHPPSGVMPAPLSIRQRTRPAVWDIALLFARTAARQAFATPHSEHGWRWRGSQPTPYCRPMSMSTKNPRPRCQRSQVPGRRLDGPAQRLLRRRQGFRQRRTYRRRSCRLCAVRLNDCVEQR